MTCPSCGRSHPLDKVADLGATPLQRAYSAEAFSKSQSIDLASAYSVLLGLMPLEKALSLGVAGDDPEAPAIDENLEPQTELLEDEDAEYDPAFRSSIANGYMTIGQAKARGDRVYYASRLAQRHGLTSYVAFLVTDNRMPLAEALRRKAAPLAPDAEQNERGLTWATLGLVAAAVCVATVGTTMFLTGGDLDSDLSGRVGGTQVQRPVPVPTVKTASEVHIDPSGEILGIRALDPETVLLAYCQSVRGNNRPSPVRIASTDSGDRLGIFRRGGTLQAILIRKEAGSAYWISSGDNGPIVPVDPTSRASLAAPAGAGG